MATTPLRIYLHDIEGLVGAGQMDEAIAHCRHILQTFPKSIAVYRLLGKAYLENQRYSDAADVFQRVLSAVPDDFVSHVGMSIIREDEGNLDASIWHMERAFESQPYNSAIQDELRRLYGQRDGMAPPKMRLTRGALARLYMKGDLYQQAIGELRAALAEDPQRPDLQALLARVYYMAGQRVEAVETCSTLLKKLPFCMDANILLGAILPETERAQDAQNYRQRAISLDPYFSHTPSNAQTAENVPTNAVTLEKLIYTPDKSGPAEGGQPAWATSLGVAFTEQKEGEALPDWLSASAEASATLEEGAKPDVVTPFAESGAPGTFPWESDSEETASTPAEPAALDTIPEWMKDAGWGAATGEAKEGPVSFDLPEEDAVPTDGELAPADIPIWLREAAPPGVLQQPAPVDEEKASEEVLPWLQETPPGPTDTIVSWLSETKSEATTPSEEAQPMPPAELFQPIETEEAGLPAPEGPTEAVEAEIPDWLKETPSSVKAETVVEPTEELPSWLQSGETTAQADTEKELPDWLSATEAETSAISTDIPDWLKSESPAEGSTPVEAEQLAGGEEDLPDWLKATPTISEAPSESPLGEITAIEATPSETDLSEQPALETIPDVAAPAETATPTEDFPAWLKEVEAEIPEEAIGTPQIEGVTEWLDTVNTGDLATGPVGITDWLKDVDTAQDTSSAEPAPSAVDIFPWMREDIAESADEPTSQEIAPAIPAEELPDWMREIEAGIPTADAAEQIKAATEIEIPDTIPPTAQVIPGEVTPAFEGEIPAGLNLEDQDAALAWLEGLAAKQGVPEEELITKPEERLEAAPVEPAEEVPDWLQAVEAEVPAEIAPVAEVAAALPAEEVPDWLKAVEAEVPAEIAPVVEVATAVPAEEVPDWLKAVEAEVPEEIAHSAEVIPAEAAPAAEGGLPAGLDLNDQDAALAWLEGLAAKQGVPEEELITKPEERLEAAPAEEVPDWLKAVEAEVPAEIAPVAEVAAALPAEEVPDWLKAVEAEVPAEIAPIAEVAPALPAEEVPDWLKAVEAEVPAEIAPIAEVAPALPAEEVPDWLQAVEAEVPEGIAPIAEVAPALPAEEVPDWLQAVEAEVPEEIAPAAEVIPAEAAPAAEGGLPAGLDLNDQDAALAWLEGLAAKQGVPEEELITKPEERLEAAPVEPAEEVPDWLQAVEAEVPAEIAPVAEVAAALPAEEVPDWLKAVEAEVPAEIAPVVEVATAVPAEEVPDWLKAVEAEAPEEIAPAAEVIPAEAAPAAEGGLPAGLDLNDQDAALAWLEGLAAKQGVPEEELITKPEERLEAAPAEEVPDWLKAVEAEVPAEIVPVAEVAAALPAEEVPDWLKAVEAEVPEEIAHSAEVIPAEAAPAAEGGLPAGLDLNDQDAALAWLEGLAAKQGVPEEELITKPEERMETPSAWVMEEAAVTQEPAAAEGQVPEVAGDHEAAGVEAQAVMPAGPAEEVPEWLKAAVEEVDQATVGEMPPAAIVPEAAPVEIPSQPTEWIKETELPEWLEKTELATPVEKEEPEAELPGWIAEATSQETEIAWEPPKTPETAEPENIPDHARTNLNSASIGELERLPGIGFVVAQSIINYRASNGAFTQLEDLLNVPGIGPGTVEVLKNWITIQPVKAEILEDAGPPLDPDHIILRQAHNALLQGDIPTAIKHYERLLGNMVLLNEIILDLQDALYRYPVDISIWQALGDAYMRNNQLQDALDAYTKAEELLR